MSQEVELFQRKFTGTVSTAHLKNVKNVMSHLWESVGVGQLFTRISTGCMNVLCVTKPEEEDKKDGNHQWIFQEKIMPYSQLDPFENFKTRIDWTTNGLTEMELEKYLLWRVDGNSSNYFLFLFKVCHFN